MNKFREGSMTTLGKSLLALVLSVMMLVTFVPNTAFADSGNGGGICH
ncbi:MAG: hypothetical protein LBN34_07070 [Clostridiales Family XIII bacterium]|jgi:hypothetical protein|nr:hypothetical protein [Clostridiales Family XIII bacterium]